MVLEACQEVGKPSQRIDMVELGGFDQRMDRGGAPNGNTAQGALGSVVAGA
jgi:hypothetical protein